MLAMLRVFIICMFSTFQIWCASYKNLNKNKLISSGIYVHTEISI